MINKHYKTGEIISDEEFYKLSDEEKKKYHRKQTDLEYIMFDDINDDDDW